MRLHFDASIQHDEKHAEIGNRDEDVVLCELSQMGNAVWVLRDDDPQRDSGDQFADQGRLAKTLGKLPEGAGYHEQNEEDVEQFHCDQCLR